MLLTVRIFISLYTWSLKDSKMRERDKLRERGGEEERLMEKERISLDLHLWRWSHFIQCQPKQEAELGKEHGCNRNPGLCWWWWEHGRLLNLKFCLLLPRQHVWLGEQKTALVSWSPCAQQLCCSQTWAVLPLRVLKMMSRIGGGRSVRGSNICACNTYSWISVSWDFTNSLASW